jgi:RNase H-like domain found in reverse transcriptase
LETNVLDYTIVAYFAQFEKDGRRHPVAYFSRKITGPKYNYDIYDKKLLAVVEAFKH